MTDGERRAMWRGVAAGALMGVAIGLLLALFVLMRPELFGAVLR